MELYEPNSLFFTDQYSAYFFCLAAVIIGFAQPHYKVNEGDGCVEVCVQILAGQLKHSDNITIRIVEWHPCKLISLSVLFVCYKFSDPDHTSTEAFFTHA